MSFSQPFKSRDTLGLLGLGVMKCDLQPLNLLKEVKSPGTPSLDGALLDLSLIFSSDEKKTTFYIKHST